MPDERNSKKSVAHQTLKPLAPEEQEKLEPVAAEKKEVKPANLSHFGLAPIRLAWFGLALPALLLNYFGQGALLLTAGHSVHNPFYQLAPSWALYPLAVLATPATGGGEYRTGRRNQNACLAGKHFCFHGAKFSADH
jgi:hypothetical protein